MQQDIAETSKQKPAEAAASPTYRNVDRIATIQQSEWQWVLVFSSILMAIISLPYIWAFAFASVESTVFTGVLVNPTDGASYLAKMMQGVRGSWFFELTFTPEPHQGVLLFSYYLALGHLARVLSIPVALLYNLVRVVSGLIMMMAIYRFTADWTEDVSQRRMSWAIAVLAGGFGWLLLPFGVVGFDILILPEAFPLQAAYSNAHFPFAIAAGAMLAHVFYTVFFVDADLRPGLNYETAGLVISIVFLALVSPFMLLPIGVACTVVVLRLWQITGEFPSIAVEWGLIVVALSLPITLNNMWAVSAANPTFAAWMSQNQTPSPALWHYLVAFGPVLILAGLGVYGTMRRRLTLEDWMLLSWIICIVVLLYAPLGLQRRFAMGLMLPLAIYAGRGLRRVLMQSVKRRYRTRVLASVFALLLPSTIVGILLPILGSPLPENAPFFFISPARHEMYNWFNSEAEPNALVLAEKSTSLFIPVYAPEQRVVFAHEFETLNAEARQSAVAAFYTGRNCEVVIVESVDYIVVGPQEVAMAAEGDQICPLAGAPVFESSDGSFVVYRATAR